MPALTPFFGLFINEGAIAIIVAVVGPAVTLMIARWAAKRQENRDGHDDEFRFRGELSTDNQALRTEIKDLKVELKEKNTYILQMEIEMRQITDDRHVREQTDVETDKRSPSSK